MENHQIPVAPDYIKNFEQMAFGMFVHFGLYSQQKRGEWAYYIHGQKMEDYRKLKDTFCVNSMAEIVQVAKSAGCQYICLTTRHHEGFSLYDTRGLSDFDVMHSPTGRDLVAEYVDECRKNDILPFFYHTTWDWYHPDFEGNFDRYLDYLYQSVEILCTRYGKIGGLWFDGNWAKRDVDWKEDRLYQMIRRHQPEAMIINNPGMTNRRKRGSDHLDAITFERGEPEPLDLRGRSKYVAGEMCETLCDNWGIGDDIDFKSVRQLVEELCECRKVGANFLLNISPNGDGTVSKIQQGIMECLGYWMSIYGKAIHNGRPFLRYAQTRNFFLKDVHDPKTAYLFCFDPGLSSGNENVSLHLDGEHVHVFENLPCRVASAAWMDNDESLLFRQEEDKLVIDLTGFPYGQDLCVRVAEVKFH